MPSPNYKLVIEADFKEEPELSHWAFQDLVLTELHKSLKDISPDYIGLRYAEFEEIHADCKGLKGDDLTRCEKGIFLG